MPDFSQLNWIPGIGDPTFIGWFITIAYFVSSALAIRVYLAAHKLFNPSIIQKQKFFWFLITLTLLFLGINKQLDLQNLVTAIGRYYAHQEGWYQNRRAIQKEFIVGLVTVIAVVASLIIGYLGKILLQNYIAIIGYILLLTFIILRASSFQHVDFIQSSQIINNTLELTGIFLIGYCAFSVKNIF